VSGELRPQQRFWRDGELARPLLVWPAPPGWQAISSAILGGGIGPIDYWLNAQVDKDYDREDPVAHARELAAANGFGPAERPRPGVVMLTAAEVERYRCADDGGVAVVATVGLGFPVPAAAPAAPAAAAAARAMTRPGTVNLLACLPVPLSAAALVNAVVTATEAKSQALAEAGVPGTGTASDAICIACPVAARGQQPEPYAGPRSPWGAALARAVHAAVASGTADWLAQHPPGDPHRFW
jgi:adenosylcobinamide hydrolase